MWDAFVEGLEARLTGYEWIATDPYSFADLTAPVAIDFARAAKLSVPDEAHGVKRRYVIAAARPSATA